MEQHAGAGLLRVWAPRGAECQQRHRPRYRQQRAAPRGGLRRKGVLKDAPDLANLDQGDLCHQVDFRSIYAAILEDWLGADDTAILGAGFERMTGLV